MADRAINHPLTPKRRWFLKTALAIGAVGASLGGLVYWHRGMAGDKLSVIFNEKTGLNQNKLDVQGEELSAANLGIGEAGAAGGIDFQDDTALSNAADALTAALTSLRSTASSMGFPWWIRKGIPCRFRRSEHSPMWARSPNTTMSPGCHCCPSDRSQVSTWMPDGVS